MTRDKAVTDLINRYLFAVGEGLPRALGADVTRELRTLIEDKLEDRAQTLGKPIDTALATYVLREIGEPGEVARRYDPSPQYLVGPRFYPAFIRIAKIGLVGLAIMLLFTTALTHALSPNGAKTLFSLTTVARLLGLYFQIAIMLFAEAVIILAIIERTKLGQQATRPREWDPHDLPEMPEVEEDRVSVAGVAVDVCLTVLFGVWLIFFPQWVGVVMVTRDSQPIWVKLTEMGVHLPLVAITVWLVLALALKLIVLGQRRWTKPTRWAEVGLGIAGAAIVFEIAARSSLHAPAAAPGFGVALQVLGSLLYVVPFALLIAPLIRLSGLIRGRTGPSALER
jgi:hypothetical protein